jgi:lysophospholipase L1-like esterase
MSEHKPSLIESIVVFIITIVVLALVLEFVLVFKNKDGRNYDIEMWKYSRELKRVSSNPKLGHEHAPNKSAKLQNIDIRINSLGMRGDEPKQADTKILFLGSSITFGWGVPETDIYPEILESKLKVDGKNVEVYNAGIGNYNSPREIELFFSKLEAIKPNIIVLNSFIRDAEVIPSPKHNWLLENSQLAVTIWSRLEQFKRKFGVEKSFEEHYKEIYADDYPGWLEMQKSFTRLAEYAQANHIRVIVTMIPDIHNLKDYPFTFIHEKIARLAQANGFEYLDFYESFKDTADQSSLWAMPGDPHPNAQGHRLMANQLSNYLAVFPQ